LTGLPNAILRFTRKRRQRLIISLTILLVWGIGLFLILGTLQRKDTAWQHVQESGTLRVGMDASYPPFETIDESSGQPVGFDVDLANEIGRRLGVSVTFTNIAYDGLYDSLVTGNVDVLVSAMADLPQVQGKAAFSLPYFNAGELLVAKRNSPFHTMDDLAGHAVAVEYGSGGDVEARKWQRRIKALEIKRYPDPEAALKAVSSGEADAAIVDGIAAELGVGQGNDLAAGPHLVDTLFAAAVASDNDVLLGKLDEAIQALAADGTLGRLTDKWFGPQTSITSP
jgi:ABC-type amino acid transport substrate-binding protein